MQLKQYQKYLVAALPILLIGLIGYYFFDIVTYIILAWILSMIGAPLYNKLRLVIGRSGASIVTILTFFIIAFTLFWVFIPPVIHQARNFANIDYEKIATTLEEPIRDWNEWLINKGILPDTPFEGADSIQVIEKAEKPLVEVFQIDSITNGLDSNVSNVTILVQVNNPIEVQSPSIEEKQVPLADTFIERAKHNLLTFLNPARVSNILSSLFGALGNTLIGVMSVLFITFFFLIEQGLFTSIVKSISPNNQEEKWSHAIDDSAQLLKRYFIGIVLQIMVITAVVSTALSLLGFENALLIGFFAALMNVIPYLGPILGATFAVIITIASSFGDSGSAFGSQLETEITQAGAGNFYEVLLPKLGILVLVFGAMQLFDNFLVQPNIFSKSVKAHPLEIFIIILVGAKLGGVLGMVVAIPLYTILRVIAKVFLSEFKIVQRMTQNM